MKKFAILLVLVAGSLWGTTGIYIRHLNAMGFEAMEIVAVKSILTSILALLLLMLVDRNLLKIRKNDVWIFVGNGTFSILLFNFCYFQAISQTSLAIAVSLLYTFPTFVLILSRIMFKEEITRKKVIAIASAFLGCILVASSGNFNGTLSYVGLMYGLCAGFGYALYSIFSRFAIIRGYHPMTITLYTFVFATLGSVPLVQYSEIRNLFTMQPTETMGNFLFLALIATLIPYILFTMGLSWIENSRAAVIVSVEPIVATVLGVLLFREVPTFSNIVGMVLIITAIIILNTKFVPALSKSHSKQ